MTVNDKINYLQETKKQIKQALIEKGQEVSDTDTFRSYATKIKNIKVGSTIGDYKEFAYILWNDTNIANSSIDTGKNVYSYSNWRIVFDIEFNSLFNYQHLMYNKLDTGAGESKNNEWWLYQNGQLAIRLNNTKYTYDGIKANTRYKIDVQYSLATKKLVINVNGAEKTYSNVTVSDTTYSNKIGNTRTNDGTGARLNAKIYGIQFYDNGNMTMNLIPVAKYEDFKKYLYDTLSNTCLKPENINFDGEVL